MRHTPSSAIRLSAFPVSHSFFPPLTNKGVVQARHNRQPHNRPPSPDNRLILKPDTQVPRQMPQSIQAVEEEGERKVGLETNRGKGGPSSDSRDHGLRLEVPSERGRGKVCEAEEVEGPGEHDAADTVQGAAIPGDLRAVDGQVRGDGALETLLGEDLGGVAGRGVLGGCESVFLRLASRRAMLP